MISMTCRACWALSDGELVAVDPVNELHDIDKDMLFGDIAVTPCYIRQNPLVARPAPIGWLSASVLPG
jgi:hypothetical protein